MMKQNLNDMEVVQRCAVIAIMATVNYVCLAFIYRPTMQYLKRKWGKDAPDFTGVYIGINIVIAILTMLAFAEVILEANK